MKLTYRGNPYEVHKRIQLGFDSIKKPKIKLIYRGNTIDYVPPVVVSVDKTDWPTATLIYRGNVYERKIPPLQPYQNPRAINWRWQ